jgi:hypothetical protein
LQYSFRGLDERNMDRNSDKANLVRERLHQPIKKKIKRKKKSLCKRAAVTKQSWTVGMNNKVRLVGSLCHIKEQFLYLAGEKLRYLKTLSYYIIHIYYTI